MRASLTALAAVLYALGWLAGKAWRVLAWSGTAVLLGWRDAQRPKVKPPEKIRRYPAPEPRSRAA